mgnify:CR=1 FL=1
MTLEEEKFPLEGKEACEVFSTGELELIGRMLGASGVNEAQGVNAQGVNSQGVNAQGVNAQGVNTQGANETRDAQEVRALPRWRRRSRVRESRMPAPAGQETLAPPTKRRLVSGEKLRGALTPLAPLAPPLPSPGASPTRMEESMGLVVASGGAPVAGADGRAWEAVRQAAQVLAAVPPGSLAARYALWQLVQRADRPALSTLQRVIKSALRKDVVQSLPAEVAYRIFAELDFRTLVRASEVCRAWRTTSEQDAAHLWKRLVLRDNLVRDEAEYDAERRWLAGLRPEKECGWVARQIYRRRRMIGQRWRDPDFHPVRKTLPCQGPSVITCLQFDDDKIAAGSDDNNITIYDTRTGKVRAVLAGHTGGVWAMKYRGNTLASGSTDRTVRIWNIAQGVCTHIFRGHVSTVRCLEIIEPRRIGTDDEGRAIVFPETPLLVTGSRDATLFVWRLPENGAQDAVAGAPVDLDERANPYLVRVLRGHTGSVRAVAGAGNILVSASYDTTARVWDLRTGECKFVLAGHADRIYSCVYDAQRSRCYTGSVDNTVRMWDVRTGRCAAILEGHQMLVGLITLSPHALVSAAADWTVRVWDPDSGAPRHVLRGHSSAITCVQNNDYFIVSGSQGMLKLWDTRTGRFIRDLVDDVNGAVWQVRFDYRRCVAAVQKTDRTCLEILDFCPPESDRWARGE